MTAFRITGNCMAGDRIYDGDYIVADPNALIRDSDIAIVKYGGQTLVKHLYRDGLGYRLEPSAPGYPEMFVPSARMAIVGRVTAVVRRP